MKKKLLFFFAVAAMFAACSSDDVNEPVTPPTDNGDDTEEVVTGDNIVDTLTATFANNTSMSISTPDDPETRGDAAHYVAVRLPKELGIQQEWLCAADDFNLRRGDEYINLVKCPEADKGIWVKRYDATEDGEGRSGLKIAVYGLDELPDDSTEYTYEVYLWVKDSVWGVDSLTNITSEFDDEMKKEWVSGDGHGTDITTQCSSWQTAGYAARYNVYKGLGGNNDTPYIKVSIHIVRDANATEGPATAVTPKEDED